MDDRKPGGEIAAELRRHAGAFGVAAAFSGLINVLALTGSVYMLQVYDRVVPSHNANTLVGLTVVMVAAYAVQASFDVLRMRLLGRIGAAIESAMRYRVAAAAMGIPLRFPGADAAQPVRDFDQIRAFAQGPAPTAVFDLPWLPVYMALIFTLNPLLGWFAVAAAVLMTAVTAATEVFVKPLADDAAKAATRRMLVLDAMKRNAETIRALGLSGRVARIWADASDAATHAQTRALDRQSLLGAASKTLRIVLQSGILGLGAWLVIHGEATPGLMIAASITMGRALAPIETAIANWRSFLAVRKAWTRFSFTMAQTPVEPVRLTLPPACAGVGVEGLYGGPPGSLNPTIQNMTFRIGAGDGLGVIGPSAAGKSTLARTLVGTWAPIKGKVTFDGADTGQWNPDELGANIGYLPQSVELFDATIAANIARFDESATAAKVIDAARAAGVHEMILQLPKGYGTRLGDGGLALSGGQRQRIGLARALYGDPFLVVLDEPNSNLDQSGEAALAKAIAGVRARKGVVVMISHRPAVLGELSHVMVLQEGRIAAFNERDKILRAMAPAAVQSVRDEPAAQTQPRTAEATA